MDDRYGPAAVGKMKRKVKGDERDGKIGIALTRRDGVAVLRFIAGQADLPSGTRQRLQTPLLTRAARHSKRRSDTAIVYVRDHEFASMKRLSPDGPCGDLLKRLVADAAPVFARRKPDETGPLAASASGSHPVDRSRVARTGSVRVLGGGLPGSGKRS